MNSLKKYKQNREKWKQSHLEQEYNKQVNRSIALEDELQSKKELIRRIIIEHSARERELLERIYELQK